VVVAARDNDDGGFRMVATIMVVVEDATKARYSGSDGCGGMMAMEVTMTMWWR